jgi:hypothetical protein
LGNQPTQHETHGQATRGNPQKVKHPLDGVEGAGQRGDQNKVEHDNGRAIVEEALSLDQQRQPLRCAQRPEKRYHRDRVGGRDQRAEHHRHRQHQRRDQGGQPADNHGGNQDTRNSQQQDARQVSAEVAKVKVERGFENQRRHQQRQDQLRRQIQFQWLLGGQEQPDNHQRDGVGNAQPSYGDRHQRHD